MDDLLEKILGLGKKALSFTASSVKPFLQDTTQKVAKFGTAIGNAPLTIIEANRQKKRTDQAIQQSNAILQRAKQLREQGNTQRAAEVTRRQIPYLKSVSDSADRLTKQAEQGRADTIRGGIDTAKTVLGYPKLFTAGGATTAALGGTIQTLIDAYKKKQDTGRFEVSPESFGKGAAETGRMLGVTRFTDPVIGGVSGKVAGQLSTKVAGQLSTVARQVVGRTITGIGNIVEDELLSRLDGVKPGLSDRALSFGIGAIASSGGKPEDWDNLKKELQSQLKSMKSKKAVEQIVDNTRIKVEQLRNSKGQFAGILNSTDPYDVKVKKIAETGAKDLSELSPKMRNDVNTYRFDNNVEAPKKNIDLVQDPENPRRLIRNDQMKESAYGLIGGFEPQKDENGNITGFTYNPTRGAVSLGLMAGFTSTKKHLADIGKALENAPDATTAEKNLIEQLTPKVEEALKSVEGGEKAAINDAKGLRAAIKQTMYNLVGADPNGGKQEYALFMAAKEDPQVKPIIDSLEEAMATIDEGVANAGKQVEAPKYKVGMEPNKEVSNFVDSYANGEDQWKKIQNLLDGGGRNGMPDEATKKQLKAQLGAVEDGQRHAVNELVKLTGTDQASVINALSTYIDAGERRGGRTLTDFYKYIEVPDTSNKASKDVIEQTLRKGGIDTSKYDIGADGRITIKSEPQSKSMSLEELLKKAKGQDTGITAQRDVFGTPVGVSVEPTGKTLDKIQARADAADLKTQRMIEKANAPKEPTITKKVNDLVAMIKANTDSAREAARTAEYKAKVKENKKIPLKDLGDIETKLYGAPTATATDLGGTKEGAGLFGNTLRKAQSKVTDVVQTGLESQNPVVRNIAKLSQGLFGGLGKSDAQLKARGEYQGTIQYGAKIANDVQNYVKDLVGVDPKSYERMHAVLDPELAKTKVNYDNLTDQEKQGVDFLKEVSDYINDTNYKNGLISEQKWIENRGGKYIARAYEAYDFAPPEVSDFLKQANPKFDLNPFKQRTDLDANAEWKMDQAIRDPAYLTAKRLQQTIFNDEVRKYSNWLSTQPNLISDVEKAGYTQLSEHKAYGDLAGKYVRKDVLEDIRGFFFTHDVAQKAYDVLNWWDRNPIRRTKKKIYTIFNPAVRLGNKTGNYVFASLNGIDPVTFTANKKWAKQAINTNDPIYRRMIQDGLVGTDVSKRDIVAFAQGIQSQLTDKKELEQVKKVISNLEKSYGGEDDIAKISAMKTWLDRGLTYDEAARRVSNGFQNYGMVGFLYDLGAKTPIFGNPFVRFASESFRIMKNAAVDRPVQTLGLIMLWKTFTDVMSAASGETPEDRATREGRVGAAHIPFTNISLNVQTPWGEVNASRLIGLYGMNSVGETGLSSDINRLAPFMAPTAENAGSDPAIGSLVSLAIDKDFRGKSIKDPNQNRYQGSLLTPEEQRANQVKYLIRQNNLPSINDVTDLIAAAKGEPNYYGSKRTLPQAVARLGGLKIEQYGATEAQAARDKEAQYMASRIESEQKKISTIRNQFKRGEITQEEAVKRTEEIQKGIQEMQGKSSGAGVAGASTTREAGAPAAEVSPYLKQLYGVDKIEAMPEGTAYEKLKKQKEAYKVLESVSEDSVLSEDQKSAIMQSIGITQEDADYYSVAKETGDLKSVYVEEQVNQLESRQELLQYLVQGRKEVNGKQLVDNTVIDYMYNQGYISKTEKNYLKKIKLDENGKPTSVSPTPSGSGGATKTEINAFIKELSSPPKISDYKPPANKASEYVDTVPGSTNFAATQISDIKIPKVEPLSVDNLIKNVNLPQNNMARAKQVIASLRASGQLASPGLKLTKSSYRPA